MHICRHVLHEKHEREARKKSKPSVNLKKEGRKCTSADMCRMKSMTGKQERKARPSVNLKKEGRKCTSADMSCMKSMTGKQERNARPGIILEKEGRKCASAESYKVGSYNASTREDHAGSRAILWLTEIDRRAHTCLMHTRIHVADARKESVMMHNGKTHRDLPEMTWNSLASVARHTCKSHRVIAGASVRRPGLISSDHCRELC